MEKAKIRPFATPKPPNRSSPKIGTRDYILSGTRHAKFCSDRFMVLPLPIYSQLAERIFTQNTPKDVVPGKEVPFVGHNDYI